MKDIIWEGNSKGIINDFPDEAKSVIGTELLTIQFGFEPSDSKTLRDIGSNVKELRVKTSDNNYRVVYIAKFVEAIYVLHCFIKKSNRISRKDLAIAKIRYKDLMRNRTVKENST